MCFVNLHFLSNKYRLVDHRLPKPLTIPPQCFLFETEETAVIDASRGCLFPMPNLHYTSVKCRFMQMSALETCQISVPFKPWYWNQIAGGWNKSVEGDLPVCVCLERFSHFLFCSLYILTKIFDLNVRKVYKYVAGSF